MCTKKHVPRKKKGVLANSKNWEIKSKDKNKTKETN